MKKPISYLLIIMLLITLFPAGAFASVQTTKTTPTVISKKVVVYIKPDFAVTVNGVRQMFRNEKGTIVYPIVYNGSTYLPIRSVSVLMKEPIEWSQAAQTVYIGKTISNPNKAGVVIPTGAAVAVKEGTVLNLPSASSEVAYLKPEVLIMYDFSIQTFLDVDGKIVYPINYQGSTYLPVRAIAALMKEPIDFDNATKTVAIGDGDETTTTTTTPVVVVTSSAAMKALNNLYNEETLLYDESTAKINNIKSATTAEEKMILATSISEDYIEAQEMSAELKALDQSKFTTEEKDLYTRMSAFFEATEYYLLVLENIAHLNAQDADYSMLAETFLYFALDSRTKMQEAKP